MAKQKHLDVWIDRLTNSIINIISGDSLPTDVLEVTAQDLKFVTKSRGWNFNWKDELNKEGIIVFKLVILGNENIIQGLISLEDRNDHVYVNLIENAPFNPDYALELCNSLSRFSGKKLKCNKSVIYIRKA
jgi:hypothetical protein